MRHVKLPLRHQSKRLVRVQTEENESRADRDVGHYFIVIRRGGGGRRVEERLRVVVVGRAKNRDVSRPHDWRATACSRPRRRREGCSDRCQRPEDACDVFDHLYELCRLLSNPWLSALRACMRCFGSTDGKQMRHGTTGHSDQDTALPRLYSTLGRFCLRFGYS
ncbi:unnamed protein product [Pelagomonas calceolata]|uniref:Uncharacterized protein n=1 Tax=Pelagomonas calceolata TaxID=35677 RepID=A0A8J2T152_9STRA|nr:unnamed protein product [Pelagomonas calceolata]CAH0380366.1 unnamed protein product [Pelagomonas calceolata]